MKEIILAILTGSGATYALGWLAGRKKNKADLEGIRLRNLESAIEIYEKVHSELKEQLESLSAKCSTLSKQITQLQSENEGLKKEIHNLNKKLNENR